GLRHTECTDNYPDPPHDPETRQGSAPRSGTTPDIFFSRGVRQIRESVALPGEGRRAGAARRDPTPPLFSWQAKPACQSARDGEPGPANKLAQKGRTVMKVKSFVDAAHLKKAVSHLPAGAADEGVRFRALVGDKKGEKDKCGGLFIGPQMLPAFEKERKTF